MAAFDRSLQHELVRKILLHKRLTRRQISEAFGISMPAVTRYVRWLEENQLAIAECVRLPGVKRPVEVLRLNPGCGTGVAALLLPGRIAAEVVGADGSSQDVLEAVIEQPTQVAVMDALRRVVIEAKNWAKRRGRKLSVAAVGVRGYLEPTSGMVFGIRGIPDWEPCLPWQVLEVAPGLTVAPVTSVACKLRGLSAQLREDHRIGFIERAGDNIAVATLRSGMLEMGRFGTASGSVHQQVSSSPRRCYCGRTGCLDEHLRHGDATEAMILAGLPAILRQMDVTMVGVECESDAEQVSRICKEQGAQEIHLVRPDNELAQTGLRLTCARVLLDRLINEMRPVVYRGVVKSSALKNAAVESAKPHMATATRG